MLVFKAPLLKQIGRRISFEVNPRVFDLERRPGNIEWGIVCNFLLAQLLYKLDIYTQKIMYDQPNIDKNGIFEMDLIVLVIHGQSFIVKNINKFIMDARIFWS